MTTAITVIATVPVGSYPWGWRSAPTAALTSVVTSCSVVASIGFDRVPDRQHVTVARRLRSAAATSVGSCAGSAGVNSMWRSVWMFGEVSVIDQRLKLRRAAQSMTIDSRSAAPQMMALRHDKVSAG